MNKLQGFYALQKSGLPSIPWQPYTAGTVLDESLLWTIRLAVQQGDDLNLPRKVGVCAQEAAQFADELLLERKPEDLIIYYPYFIARKSGVLEVAQDRMVMEAVRDDLWNLVTYGRRDVSILFSQEDVKFVGDKDFLTVAEVSELIDHGLSVKRKFGPTLSQGRSLFLEWSFACPSDTQKQPLGQPKLVFYEMRSVAR